jgi:hypothetical protein
VCTPPSTEFVPPCVVSKPVVLEPSMKSRRNAYAYTIPSIVRPTIAANRNSQTHRFRLFSWSHVSTSEPIRVSNTSLLMDDTRKFPIYVGEWSARPCRKSTNAAKCHILNCHYIFGEESEFTFRSQQSVMGSKAVLRVTRGKQMIER